MEGLFIESTPISPRISFDTKERKFLIAGESRPENAGRFYSPVLEWIKKYCSIELNVNKTQPLVFDFRLEYFNSTSAKFILDIIKELEEAAKKGTNITCNWHFNKQDEDMKEAGKEFKKLSEAPFNLVEE